MAENPVLSPISSFVNDTSAAATYNANNALITNSFADCLSLSGTLPNSMLSNLDMNSNQIINLPAPSTINSPVRLGDLTTGTTVNTTTFGVLAANQTWTGTNTFSSAIRTNVISGGAAAGSQLVVASTTSASPSGDLVAYRGSSHFFQNATGAATYGEIFPSGGWCISSSPADPGAGNLQVGGSILAGSGIAATGAIQVLNGTAPPAGGTAGFGLRFFSTSNFGVFGGSGAPSLSAAKGSLYLRTDGTTTNNRAYINTDGGTTWTAITTVG